MPSVSRIFESCLYSLINFLPYFFLALYPFTGKFRFSRAVNSILFTLLLALEIAVTIWASLFSTHNASVSFLNTFGFAAFFFLAVKEHPGKQLFVLLMISNLANQIVFSAKCLEGFLFPALALENNRWSFSVATVIMQLIFVPFFFLFEKKKFKEAITLQTQEQIWRYLWLIPGIFYLFWFYLAYLNPLYGIHLALQPRYTAFAVLINIGAMLVYYIVAKALESFSQNMELRTQNHLLAIQNLQYEHLKFRMDEMKQTRHDLRQHLTILQTFCENEEYDKLRSYLQNYLRSLPPDHSIAYCEHFTLNALLVYYAQIAWEHRIDFSVRLCLPQDISISDPDLTVLFGNLLENACEGCMTVPAGQRQIQLRGEILNQNSFVFTLDNTFSGKVQMEKGRFLSSKQEEHGIGLRSVQDIVNKYNGTVKFETEKKMFCVSIVLNLPSDKPDSPDRS